MTSVPSIPSVPLSVQPDVTIAPVGLCYGVYIRGKLAVIRPDEAHASRTAARIRSAICDEPLPAAPDFELRSLAR